MHVAYIVLAHQYPAQLGRLVRRLHHASTSIYVHVDARSSPEVMGEMLAAVDGIDAVQFLPRIRCYWGGYGVVEASINGIRAALGSVPHPDIVVLLSGQDYPVLPAESLVSFYESRPGKSFVGFDALPNYAQFPHGGGRHLYQDWHLIKTRARTVHIPMVRRRVPCGMTIYKGLGYWSLAREHARYVVDLIDRNPKIARFFRRVMTADELTVQTLVANSPFLADVINLDLHYTDWHSSSDPAHPKVLTLSDLNMILGSGALYVRKVDPTASADLMRALDRHPDATAPKT